MSLPAMPPEPPAGRAHCLERAALAAEPALGTVGDHPNDAATEAGIVTADTHRAHR